MRQHLDIARGLPRRTVFVIAVVTLACGAARAAVPMPVDTGYPSDLINTPVCAIIDRFDDARDCARIGWPEGASRAYRPMR